jgi:hypothetical protein
VFALPGDWLIIEPDDPAHQPRNGLIVEVHSPDGAPP